ncbi:MAG: NAD(P)H-hydrate dehydratase [Planctomycetota bacterium]
MTVHKQTARGDVNMPAERSDRSHKGDYGHVLVVGGAPGMTGAARMAAKSAQLAGAGRITMGLPAGLNLSGELGTASIMSCSLPDTPDTCLGLRAALYILESVETWDVCALGPGLGRAPSTSAMVSRLVADLTVPLVVDADGLNAMAGKTAMLIERSHPTVLTPHPGEMGRLIRCPVEDVQADRVEVARAYAEQIDAVVVLKGHETVISNGDETWLNCTGNPGMATGGMGDVLTGLIAGLLGQGMEAMDAARLAVFIHVYAGDAAADKTSQMALNPEMLMDQIPETWNQ